MLACMFSCRSSESSIICQSARSSRSLLRSAALNSLLVGLLACSRAYFLRLFLSGPWPLHYSTDLAPWRLAFVFIYFFCVHVFSCVYTCNFWWYMACLPVWLVVGPSLRLTCYCASLLPTRPLWPSAFSGADPLALAYLHRIHSPVHASSD